MKITLVILVRLDFRGGRRTNGLLYKNIMPVHQEASLWSPSVISCYAFCHRRISQRRASSKKQRWKFIWAWLAGVSEVWRPSFPLFPILLGTDVTLPEQMTLISFSAWRQPPEDLMMPTQLISFLIFIKKKTANFLKTSSYANVSKSSRWEMDISA